jgi:acetate---CoA ligase (ADP-forming) subunit beta
MCIRCFEVKTGHSNIILEADVDILKNALESGRKTLSERESKEILKQYGIPVTREIEVRDQEGLKQAIQAVGLPLVLKGSGPDLAHKTELGLVRVDIRSEQEALAAFEEISSAIGEGASVLVQEMVKGQRELVVGMTRDAQFGPCVMFGLGGIFTEILKDVSFRVAPIEKRDALEMMKEIKGRKILDSVRGLPPADLDQLAHILIQVGNIGVENQGIKEIDINPIILKGGTPIAVDALVVLEP